MSMDRHPLQEVFSDAVAQAVSGKGEQKHGLGKGFYDQQWVDVTKRHGLGFLTGQAVKKINEAVTIPSMEMWEREMLGALNYIAMAVIFKRIENEHATRPPNGGKIIA